MSVWTAWLTGWFPILSTLPYMLSFSTLFDVDFGELNEEDFGLYLMVCSPYLEVKASLKRLKALTSKPGEHEK